MQPKHVEVTKIGSGLVKHGDHYDVTHHDDVKVTSNVPVTTNFGLHGHSSYVPLHKPVTSYTPYIPYTSKYVPPHTTTVVQPLKQSIHSVHDVQDVHNVDV